MTTHIWRKTSTHLADGRELFYFDDSDPYVSGAATRRLDDPRPLPDRFATTDGQASSMAPIMRRDPLTGEWIPMAAHRMNRTFLPPADANPLAPARPGAEYSDGEIPDTDYDVVVFENRFPSLLEVPGVPDEPTLVDGQPVFAQRPAAGRCEVVCFSPDATKSLKDVDETRMRTIIEAWADRTTALEALPHVEQVFCFENRGEEIGVTLHHPHGQIYGYPYVTPRTQQMVEPARRHREETGRSLLDDVLAAELATGERVVAETEHWVLFVPFAARWPVELHLVPRRRVRSLPELTDAERADLAPLYLRMLAACDRFFDRPLPYVAGWHQGPPALGDLLGLHLELLSIRRSPEKLKYLAGSESGMGAWVSDTTPERIAARMREVWS
ncbi:galactose-1-phosphate uridylyltransferase [Actinomycetota bacterium]